MSSFMKAIKSVDTEIGLLVVAGKLGPLWEPPCEIELHVSRPESSGRLAALLGPYKAEKRS